METSFANEKVKDLVTKGAEYFAAGGYTKSLICYNQANSLSPDNLNIISLRAGSYRKVGYFDKANSDYIKIIKSSK